MESYNLTSTKSIESSKKLSALPPRFSEFPFFTGTTRHSRRIDFLCVENITTENLWELNILGIEIKVSCNDLQSDEKYTEYTEFFDYFYLAVPKELEEVAKKNKFKGCGLIVHYY